MRDNKNKVKEEGRIERHRRQNRTEIGVANACGVKIFLINYS